MANTTFFLPLLILDFVPHVKFGKVENLLDVLRKYEILGFCRLDINKGHLLDLR
jgi:hypothetical protein